jgi:hypothetical protein
MEEVVVAAAAAVLDLKVTVAFSSRLHSLLFY